ncbi:unnamed protein product [Polarella glacialis]|uniref:Peptidyl-prolyl cis-trans isomerase n=1 Tax=Polarella glacialis TaxID=89957 RepID=A0A813D7F0_POLGL|nr:unnamed protein product [Polarella glacialis]
MPNPWVFFEIALDGKVAGRVEFELYADLVPKTAENFRCLCTGEKGRGRSGKQLAFLGSAFHRIIPGFMCQGGDFTTGDGKGGESIYGGKFADENFKMKHTGIGCLSMANAGPNTNGSQFFVCLGETPHLNGKHVVFGKVISGLPVLTAMERCGSSGGKTSKKVTIRECGEVGRLAGSSMQAGAENVTNPAAKKAKKDKTKKKKKDKKKDKKKSKKKKKKSSSSDDSDSSSSS